jgi:hypothetical protein
MKSTKLMREEIMASTLNLKGRVTSNISLLND